MGTSFRRLARALSARPSASTGVRPTGRPSTRNRLGGQARPIRPDKGNATSEIDKTAYRQNNSRGRAVPCAKRAPGRPPRPRRLRVESSDGVWAAWPSQVRNNASQASAAVLLPSRLPAAARRGSRR
jgi:hypothetical protein